MHRVRANEIFTDLHGISATGKQQLSFLWLFWMKGNRVSLMLRKGQNDSIHHPSVNPSLVSQKILPRVFFIKPSNEFAAQIAMEQQLNNWETRLISTIYSAAAGSNCKYENVLLGYPSMLNLHQSLSMYNFHERCKSTSCYYVAMLAILQRFGVQAFKVWCTQEPKLAKRSRLAIPAILKASGLFIVA